MCIWKHFKHGKCFIWDFLVLSVLVFSVYKNLKSNHHLLFLAVFPNLEMLQFSSVNYICQVSKLLFYFGQVRHFGQYLYFRVFSKQWKYPTFSFVKYMLFSHCSENCIFMYFLKAENPCFVTNNCSKSYFWVFILSKKQQNWFQKNFHYSGTQEWYSSGMV